MITRRANVFFSFLFSLLLVACGGSGAGAGDAVEDFLRALEWDDQERVQELLHSEADIVVDMGGMFTFDMVNLLERAAEEISDRDGISRIEIVSEQAVELGLANIELAIGTDQVQRVETRITFGDGSQLEITWLLAMHFERYQILEIPDFRSG